MTPANRRAASFSLFAPLLIGLAACTSQSGQSAQSTQLMAPGIDHAAESRTQGADAVTVGHRLIEAGEYELAIRAFNRAALERGTLDTEILSGLGTANLQLGRLGQAEKLLKRAINQDGAQPVDLNNYGVLLMEQGDEAQAVQYFHKAYALSNGENVAIRENLSLALAKSENPANVDPTKGSDYKLVRRGSSDFVIRPKP